MENDIRKTPLYVAAIDYGRKHGRLTQCVRDTLALARSDAEDHLAAVAQALLYGSVGDPTAAQRTAYQSLRRVSGKIGRDEFSVAPRFSGATKTKQRVVVTIGDYVKKQPPANHGENTANARGRAKNPGAAVNDANRSGDALPQTVASAPDARRGSDWPSLDAAMGAVGAGAYSYGELHQLADTVARAIKRAPEYAREQRDKAKAGNKRLTEAQKSELVALSRQAAAH